MSAIPRIDLALLVVFLCGTFLHHWRSSVVNSRHIYLFIHSFIFRLLPCLSRFSESTLWQWETFSTSGAHTKQGHLHLVQEHCTHDFFSCWGLWEGVGTFWSQWSWNWVQLCPIVIGVISHHRQVHGHTKGLLPLVVWKWWQWWIMPPWPKKELQHGTVVDNRS